MARLGNIPLHKMAPHVKMAGRKSYKGKSRKASQHKNVSETFERKYQALVYLDAHSMSETIAAFYTDTSPYKQRNKRRNIERWRKQRESIEAKAKGVDSRRLTRMRSLGSATTLSHETELKIVEWINNMRKEGIPVMSQMLQLKGIDCVYL
jgi:hypothetical protein